MGSVVIQKAQKICSKKSEMHRLKTNKKITLNFFNKEYKNKNFMLVRVERD